MGDTLTITRHAIRNYGSLLQARATQVLIESAGSQCKTIDYRQPGVDDTARGYRPRPNGLTGVVKDVGYRAFRAHGARRRGALFEGSLRSDIRLTSQRFDSFDSLVAHAWPEEAVYCVGSDQVWNLETNVDNRPYYLSFAPQTAKRFSLASSIGMDTLPKSEEALLIEALRRFAGVSVRESDAVDYLGSLGIPAVQHIDPTLALSGREWSEFAGERLRRSSPYVLVYQLNSHPWLHRAALDVGRLLGLPVVRMEYWQTLRGRGASTVMRPSPQRFVSLIRDASVLVSDSFHGAAFAINLGTRLVAVSPPRYGHRLSSLLAQFGLEGLRAWSPGEAVDIVRNQKESPDSPPRLWDEQERVRQYIRQMVQPPEVGSRREEGRI